MMVRERIIDSMRKNVVRIGIVVHGKEGNGSGLVIDDNGTILTCEHVVRPDGTIPDRLWIRGYDGQDYEPEIVQLVPQRDIAILRVPELNGMCSFKSYDDVNVGDQCLVFGYPMNIYHLSALDAMVSAKGEHLVSNFPFKLIQIDARVNRGNSGGPVIDIESGEVIGIVTLKYIPFLSSVEELQAFVRSIPPAPESVEVVISSVAWGRFFNYVNEAISRIANALMLVQVGIGWVIPADLLLPFL